MDRPFKLPDHGYIYTQNWGIFDINHINDGRNKAKDILDHITDPIDHPNPLHLSTPVGNSVISEELEVNYDVKRPIPEQLQQQVGLSIFLDYENRFERLQGRSIFQAGSSYAFEDFPSDYLGFYGQVSGLETEVILEDILKEKPGETYFLSSGKPLRADRRAWAPQNQSIDPVVCSYFIGVPCTTKPWPDEMRIEPYQGDYWRLKDCVGKGVIHIPVVGPQEYQLGCE